jgi:transposase
VLSWEADVEAHALRAQGWTISAIARHLGVDRKTVRAYLSGQRTPGVRVRTVPDVIDPFLEYCRLRLADDPHLWASTLFDEVQQLGFAGAYSSLTAAIRKHGLRPHCEPCQVTRGRDVAIIAHPAGEETQWDWVELPDPPPTWGCGKEAHLLVGALSHSGRWRGVLAAKEDQPHLVEAMDGVLRRLGGVTRRWRFDRMATVCYPASGRITASFAGIAKYYAAAVDVCPPRRGNRKGVVEKANHSAAQRWWRTLSDDISVRAAQDSLDALCERLDGRRRMREGQRTTVGELAQTESLRACPPAPFPAELELTNTVTAQGLVPFRGNHYSVPPGMRGTSITVRHRLGTDTVRLATASGVIVAQHRRKPDGAGETVRDDGHVIALEKAVLEQFGTGQRCQHKTRRPPSTAALAEASRLRGVPTGDPAARVVIDMSTYAAAAARLKNPPPTPDGVSTTEGNHS